MPTPCYRFSIPTQSCFEVTDSAPGVEMLDVFDDLGCHLGVKSRDAVHQSGDWHRVFHCQIAAIRNGVPVVVLQRRSNRKAAFPGLLDLSAAGHLAAGEAPLDGVRELTEELGVSPNREKLVLLGERRLVDDSGEGRLNKEITSVFLLRDDRPLNGYVLQRAEVDAVFDAPIDDLLALFAGDINNVELFGVEHAGSEKAREVSAQVSLTDFVPGQSYWVSLFIMCERFLRGERPLAI
jgi:isopentenyldiphosphate isomerase